MILRFLMIYYYDYHCYYYIINESISLSSSKSYRRAEIGYVMKVNCIRK